MAGREKRELSISKKKLIAILLVLILLFAGIGYIFYDKGPTTEEEEPPLDLPRYPYLNCDADCNIPLSIKPRPSSETHVVVNPNDPDNIVASSNDLNNPSEDVWLHFYTTKDGGDTWSDGMVPGYRGGPPSILTGMGTACDPALAFDGDDNVYLAGIAYNRHMVHIGRATMIFVARSSNGGDTFDQVTQVSNSWTRIGRFHDKEWIAADLDNGNVYVTWTMFNGYMTGSIMFSMSTDQGRTFSIPTKLADITTDLNAQGSFVAVDRNGTVHVVWRDFSDDSVHYIRSTDAGNSWTPVRAIIQMDPPPWALDGGTYRTPTMPHMAIDMGDGPYSGSMYIVWADERLGEADAFLSFSRDGGDTWNDTYVRINNDTIGNGVHQFFPTVIVSPQGYVHTMFYDKRYDENRTWLGVTYAVSVDGGQNFSLNMNATDVIFDGDLGGKSHWSAITGDDSGFIGDYLGIAANNDTAFLVWGDTRNASETDGNSDIYAARVVFAGEDGDVNDTYDFIQEHGFWQ